MTKPQIKRARWLLSQAGLKGEDRKADLVFSFTDGRTESLTAMEYAETQALFAHLEEKAGIPPSEADKSKRKILSLAHEMKWHYPGTRKVDMPRVNGWCQNKFDYDLDDLNYSNLNRAVTAFEKVHLSYLKGI